MVAAVGAAEFAAVVDAEGVAVEYEASPGYFEPVARWAGRYYSVSVVAAEQHRTSALSGKLLDPPYSCRKFQEFHHCPDSLHYCCMNRTVPFYVKPFLLW